jgi:hypothetical protein
MNFMTLPRLAAVAAAVALLAGGAQAASVVSATETFEPTTELITFNGYDGLTSTGQYLDSDGDVLFSSTAAATLGASELNLDGNGLWGARVFGPTPTGEGNFLAAFAPVLFNFGADGPQAQVGAFFNLSQALEGAKVNSLTLTAYGEGMQVLESFSYTVDTSIDGYNEGMFLGFSRTSADIYNFGISASGGAAFAMDNLSLTMAPIPEPGAVLLMLAGLGMTGMVMRRRQRS